MLLRSGVRRTLFGDIWLLCVLIVALDVRQSWENGNDAEARYTLKGLSWCQELKVVVKPIVAYESHKDAPEWGYWLHQAANARLHQPVFVLELRLATAEIVMCQLSISSMPGVMLFEAQALSVPPKEHTLGQRTH